MLKQLLRAARGYLVPRAAVLMYHRVAEPATDAWELAVSPAHFEQQLRVLRGSFALLSAAELVARVRRGAVPRRGVALTFDDGYADNYHAAQPLLERYGVPATFFITTDYLGQQREFWWDELEHLFLEAEPLPPALALPVGGQLVAIDLAAEQRLTPALRQQHRRWSAAAAPPPTARAAAYYRVWELLKPLPHQQQQDHLRALRTWAGLPNRPRPGCLAMTPAELLILSQSPLFTIGAHTVTHPALATHPAAVQAPELAASRRALRDATGQPVALLAYPYGSHGPDTPALAAAAGFGAAFTTAAQVLTSRADPYRLGRFQVGDWDGPEFRRRLRAWLG